jgi:hypothetical protein
VNVDAYVAVIECLCCERETVVAIQKAVLEDIPLLYFNQTSHEVN